MLFSQHQIPPQSQELFPGFDEAREIEELGLAVGTMVMVNRHFLESKSMVLELFHQLETDGAGGGGEVDLVEDSPAHEAEIAIHVTQAESEKEPNDVVIKPADNNPVKGIKALNLEPVDHVTVLCDRCD